MSEAKPQGYEYHDTTAGHTQGYLWVPVFRELDALVWPTGKPKRVFDLGCGNGALAAALAKRGYDLSGVDPSEDGIRIANQAHPTLNLKSGSAYDDLAASFGQVPAVESLEVVEHVFYPRKYAKALFDLLEPGGIGIVSTPYHSYWKNVVLAVSGKMDAHFTALWDYGHIKFWSYKTLTELFAETGLLVERYVRVGRIPILAKSMIAIVRKPQ